MKMILINKCADPQKWYYGKNQQLVDYVRGPDIYGDVTSRDDGGHVNIVKAADCTIIDVVEQQESLS